MRKACSLLLFLCSVVMPMDAQTDTTAFVHRLEADVLPSAILHTNRYLKGGNEEGRTMNHAFTARLKYAFQAPEGSRQARIYKGAYQGVGVAVHDFNWQLGHPWSFFVFQGARIKRFAPAVSLNYEWNLGLTAGWHPYDTETNPDNKVIGSRITAYIDADLYLNWRLSRHFDLNTGVSGIHFSNGNTGIPNAGLNVVGARVSLAYYFNRPALQPLRRDTLPRFRRHMSYDLVFYGAWHRLGFNTDEAPVVLPGHFGVYGFHFTPLYNVNHWFSTGVSVDGVYDRAANVFKNYNDDIAPDDESIPGTDLYLTKPRTTDQMALGLSARAEFVMPYFSINMGVGHYLLGAHGDLNEWYQLLALKVNVSRHLFLHIGYSLHDFKYPNHLMLGLGWHFNRKRGM